MQENWQRSVALMLVASVALAACSSSTMIRTRPPGAKVYVNGEYIGESPARYRDSRILGATNDLEIEMDGYKDKRMTFTKDEKADVGAIIGGIFFLVPFLWTFGYKNNRLYELDPVTAEAEKSLPNLAPKVSSKAERIRELKQLFDEGIITQEEFEASKRQILFSDPPL